jgi:hypothetical protein
MDIVDELRKRAKCVFLATEAGPAQDLSDHMKCAHPGLSPKKISCELCGNRFNHQSGDTGLTGT